MAEEAEAQGRHAALVEEFNNEEETKFEVGRRRIAERIGLVSCSSCCASSSASSQEWERIYGLGEVETAFTGVPGGLSRKVCDAADAVAWRGLRA
jgi:hypothetical protein